ncbi:MAG: DUF6503 family protein [Bacteroidota bacterium]
MKRILYLIISIFVLFGCSQQNNKKEDQSQVETVPNEAVATTTVYPAVLAKALAAHGGLEKWQSFGTLEYEMQKPDFSEYQLIDLKNRKTLLITDNYKLGFDGEQAWVIPSKDAFGGKSIRFYHNLYFYFFSLPFVLADPGIEYEEMGEETVDGKAYNVLKISYGENVGDSPEDNYICYFNKDDNMLDFIRYTVTYYSKEQSTKYNALKYDDWQEINGMKLPLNMSFYTWEDGSFGKQRSSAVFENVVFSNEVPNTVTFQKPEGAEVESNPTL